MCSNILLLHTESIRIKFDVYSRKGKHKQAESKMKEEISCFKLNYTSTCVCDVPKYTIYYAAGSKKVSGQLSVPVFS